MLGRDQAREHPQPALHDRVVVVAAAELDPAVLQHLQAPTLRAVLRLRLLEQQHAVRDAAHLQVLLGRGHVVEQQHGALAVHEELLERQDLAPVAQRVAGQQPHLGQRVEHHARRLQGLDVGQHPCRRRGQLDLRGVKHRAVGVRFELGFRRRELAKGDAFEVPSVRVGDRPQFVLRLRQAHVEHRLAGPGARQQELHRQRRLARAGSAFDEVEPIAPEAAGEDVVQPRDAGWRGVAARGSVRHGHSS